MKADFAEQPEWQKSSRSDTKGDQCVEVAILDQHAGAAKRR
jgi:Domain of unknown function (DUF397)